MGKVGGSKSRPPPPSSLTDAPEAPAPAPRKSPARRLPPDSGKKSVKAREEAQILGKPLLADDAVAIDIAPKAGQNNNWSIDDAFQSSDSVDVRVEPDRTQSDVQQPPSASRKSAYRVPQRQIVVQENWTGDEEQQNNSADAQDNWTNGVTKVANLNMLAGGGERATSPVSKATARSSGKWTKAVTKVANLGIAFKAPVASFGRTKSQVLDYNAHRAEAKQYHEMRETMTYAARRATAFAQALAVAEAKGDEPQWLSYEDHRKSLRYSERRGSNRKLAEKEVAQEKRLTIERASLQSQRTAQVNNMKTKALLIGNIAPSQGGGYPGADDGF